MASGKAYGPAREYQILTRDILIERSSCPLVPVSGDGIDVPISIGDVPVPRSFDVALKQQADGKMVVAECKRTARRVNLTDLDAFAQRVELLRKKSGAEVAGFYFTRTAYQSGVIKAAEGMGISVVVCVPDQPVTDFAVVFHKYDCEREVRIKKGVAHFASVLKPTGRLGRRVIRANGTIENHCDI